MIDCGCALRAHNAVNRSCSMIGEVEKRSCDPQRPEQDRFDLNRSMLRVVCGPASLP
jgi:hypothetical protein